MQTLQLSQSMLIIQKDRVFIKASSVNQIIYCNKISKALECVCHLHKTTEVSFFISLLQQSKLYKQQLLTFNIQDQTIDQKHRITPDFL